MMANPIHERLVTGTIGELLVQLRLLQYGVQAAAPLKDSGNDLIALRGYEIRTIQVKTSAMQVPVPRNLPERYHLLALVLLRGFGDQLRLDDSQIFLVPRDDVDEVGRDLGKLAGYEINQEHIDALFGPE